MGKGGFSYFYFFSNQTIKFKKKEDMWPSMTQPISLLELSCVSMSLKLYFPFLIPYLLCESNFVMYVVNFMQNPDFMYL